LSQTPYGRTGRAEDTAVGVPDEYQDGVSAGSLVKARRCWLHLSAADALPLPQRFAFVFQSPTRRMALGLMDFLRYAHYAGFVRTNELVGLPLERPWQVAGTTLAAIWSLPSLEHLFMHLRGAGPRYESMLVTVDVVPMSRGFPRRGAAERS